MIFTIAAKEYYCTCDFLRVTPVIIRILLEANRCGTTWVSASFIPPKTLFFNRSKSDFFAGLDFIEGQGEDFERALENTGRIQFFYVIFFVVIC